MVVVAEKEQEQEEEEQANKAIIMGVGSNAVKDLSSVKEVERISVNTIEESQVRTADKQFKPMEKYQEL